MCLLSVPWQGEDSISDYSITFHYVPPKKMQALEFYIYHLGPYGIMHGLQNLNKPHGTTATARTPRS